MDLQMTQAQASVIHNYARLYLLDCKAKEQRAARPWTPTTLIDPLQQEPKTLIYRQVHPLSKPVAVVLCRDDPVQKKARFSNIKSIFTRQTDHKPVRQTSVFAVFQSEGPAREYVDTFIKHYCPTQCFSVDNDEAEVDRCEKFLAECKRVPVPVVNYKDDMVLNSRGEAVQAYKVLDERRKRIRMIWIDVLTKEEMTPSWPVALNEA